jgi:hypothetical protein
MRRIAPGATVGLAIVLALASGMVAAQGVAPGGPIGGSTGIGSGLGIPGTGPGWPNGSNQVSPNTAPSVPPGGYGPRSTVVAPSPSMGPSHYPRLNEPFATSSLRPPASIPLQLPGKPNGSLEFVKGCWRSDNFAYGGHRGTVTWCFDDKGGGRYLYTRTDAPNVFFCHAQQAEARWEGQDLHLSGKPTCDDGSANAPAELICRDGTDGALCSDPEKSWSVRLYRVR